MKHFTQNFDTILLRGIIITLGIVLCLLYSTDIMAQHVKNSKKPLHKEHKAIKTFVSIGGSLNWKNNPYYITRTYQSGSVIATTTESASEVMLREDIWENTEGESNGDMTTYDDGNGNILEEQEFTPLKGLAQVGFHILLDPTETRYMQALISLSNGNQRYLSIKTEFSTRLYLMTCVGKILESSGKWVYKEDNALKNVFLSYSIGYDSSIPNKNLGLEANPKDKVYKLFGLGASFQMSKGTIEVNANLKNASLKVLIPLS